jgi:drug/metabolite transporter (DMT)-like permease
MAVIWGSNYSIVKSAFAEVPPFAFNGLRLAVASLLFLVILAVDARRSPAARTRILADWRAVAAIAVVGHALYQLLFIAGLARTSAANSALIIGCTPVFVALLTAALGHERVPARRWAGVALSATGIYLVVGHGAAMTHDSLGGDLLMLAAVFCWSLATILLGPVLTRHAPLTVTGYSMALGTVLYLPFAWRDLAGVDWSRVSSHAWLALLYSACLALCVAYVIWYTAVQRLGNTRTAVYSNMVPVVAMVVAAVGFGEPVGWLKIAGAAAILVGVAVTRL